MNHLKIVFMSTLKQKTMALSKTEFPLSFLFFVTYILQPLQGIKIILLHYILISLDIYICKRVFI